MKGSKILADAVLAGAAFVAAGGVANAQSIGAGVTQPSGASRADMAQTPTGQTPTPGMTSTDPSTSPTSPRMNPTPDTSMQGMDRSSPSSRMNSTDRDMGTSSGTNPGISPGSTSMDMPSGQSGMSDSSMPMRERRAKPDRN